MLRKLRKNKGFTLVEITMVVGIVILLVAVSIHGILRVKVNSNNSAVIGNVKAVAAALISFNFASNGFYTAKFDVLTSNTASTSPPYLPEAFADSNHQGYDFFILLENKNSERWLVYAQPEHYGVTGTMFIVYDNNLNLQQFDDFYEARAYCTSGAIIIFPEVPRGLPPVTP